MATTVVSDPSGKEYEVNHPDGASDDEIIAYAKNYFGKVAAPPPVKAPVPPAPDNPYLSAARQTATDIGVGVPSRIMRDVAGMAQLPGQLAQATRAIDWPDLLKHPSIIGRAGLETAKTAAKEIPTVAGAVGGGLLAGPLGMGIGAAYGKGLSHYLGGAGGKQGAEAVRESALEGLTTGAESYLTAKVPQGYARLSGRTPEHRDMIAAGAFERSHVEPTLSDVTTGRLAGPMEKLGGSLWGGSDVFAKRTAHQYGQIGAAFRRIRGQMGETPTREAVGPLVSDAVTDALSSNKATYAQWKDALAARGQGEVFPTTTLRDRAASLLQEFDQQPYRELAKRVEDSRLPNLFKEIVGGKKALSWEEMDRLIRDLGAEARSTTVIGTPLEGKFKALYQSAMDTLSSSTLSPAERQLAQFYKERIVPLSAARSRLGQITTGKLPGEEAGTLLSRTGLSDIKELNLLAPKAVQGVRNRFISDIFDQAQVVDPQMKVFYPERFREAWNSIHPETKAALFKNEPHIQRGFDDIAIMAHRMGWKPAPGSKPGAIPLGQFIQFMSIPGSIASYLVGATSAAGSGAIAMLLPIAAYLGSQYMSKARSIIPKSAGMEAGALLPSANRMANQGE